MKSFAKLFVFLALFSLLLAACGGDDATPTPEGGLPTAVSEAAATEEASSLCSVIYAPVSEGASWRYQGSSESGPFTWTTQTSAVSDTSFTVTQTHDTTDTPLIVTQHWTCSEEGVTALEYGGGADASLTYTGLNVSLETLETTGITIPRQINPGDTWQQTFQIEGTITADGMVSNIAGSITQSYQALEHESVSTPAGAFEALTLEVVTSFDLHMDVMGMSVPFSMVSSNTNWLAPNVGWVKSAGSATVEGAAGFESTIDLQSYNIP